MKKDCEMVKVRKRPKGRTNNKKQPAKTGVVYLSRKWIGKKVMVIRI